MIIEDLKALDKTLSRESVGYLKGRVSSFDTPLDYVNELSLPGTNVSNSPLTRMLANIAGKIDPSQVDGGEEDMGVVTAFMRGGLPAVDVAHQFLPYSLNMHMANNINITADFPDGGTEQDKRLFVAHTLVQLSSDAYDEAELFHEELEGWHHSLMPDVTKQFYLKIGFGFIYWHFKAMREVVSQTDLRVFNLAVDGGVPADYWDVGLQDLAGEAE